MVMCGYVPKSAKELEYVLITYGLHVRLDDGYV